MGYLKNVFNKKHLNCVKVASTNINCLKEYHTIMNTHTRLRKTFKEFKKYYSPKVPKTTFVYSLL